MELHHADRSSDASSPQTPAPVSVTLNPMRSIMHLLTDRTAAAPSSTAPSDLSTTTPPVSLGRWAANAAHVQCFTLSGA